MRGLLIGGTASGFSIEMTNRLAKLGYVTVELTRDCLLGKRGMVVRGHSFHYSRIVDEPSMPTSYSVSYSLSGKREDKGFSAGNVRASYVYLHFRAAPQIARHFVEFTKFCKSDIQKLKELTTV